MAWRARLASWIHPTKAPKCLVCGCPTADSYKVKLLVWLDATRKGERNRNLHLRCLEKRLGRALRLEDFTHDEVNEPIRWGYACRQREEDVLRASC